MDKKNKRKSISLSKSCNLGEQTEKEEHLSSGSYGFHHTSYGAFFDLSAFSIGWAVSSLINVAGNHASFDKFFSDYDDAKALRSDWEDVGSSIYDAIVSLDKK